MGADASRAKARRLDRALKEQHGHCYYCRCKLVRAADCDPLALNHQPAERATEDHKMPKSRGGTNAAPNTVAACVTCNRKKDDMTDVEFRKRRSRWLERRRACYDDDGNRIWSRTWE